MSSVPPTAEAWLEEVLGPDRSPCSLYRRPPYQHHKDHVDQLEPIFRALAGDVPFSGLSKLSQALRISDSTLFNWKKNLRTNPSWRPSRRAYAIPRRIFTEEQEDILVQRIRTSYLDHGLYYCDEDFRHDALRFYEEIHAQLKLDAATNPDAQRRLLCLPLFKATVPFIRDFRLRNRFSLRRPALKKRCAATVEMQEAFLQRVQTLLGQYPHDRIINIDETNWRSVSPGFWTWATTGTESVSVQIANDDKEGITAIAGVDATGMKLPLTVIGKGKTPRCLAALDLPPEIWTATSKSGWTTVDVMLRYFQLLRENLYPTGPLVLLLDTYSAHRAAATKEAAMQLGIELVFIPPGCTDRLQPLDRRIFGVLKAHAREIWRTHYHMTHGAKTTRSMMARNLLIAWERITPDIIESAWDIIFQGEWSSDDGGEPNDRGDDEEFQLRMRQEDLDDLE
jgi:hypothetical protein